MASFRAHHTAPDYDVLPALLSACTARSESWWTRALGKPWFERKSVRYHPTTRNLTVGRDRAVLERLSGDELIERAFARGLVSATFDPARYEWGVGLAHARCGWALYYDCADCVGMGIFGTPRRTPGLHEALHVLALRERETAEELVKEACHALRRYGGPVFRGIRWLVVPPGAWRGNNPVWESPRLPPFEPCWQLFPSGGLTEGSSSMIVARNEPLRALVKLGVNIHRIDADGLVQVAVPSVWEVVP